MDPIAPGTLPVRLPDERKRSIQQTATHRAYESTELRHGILSGKVASERVVSMLCSHSE
jgi:hypothetical protein